MVTLTEQVLGLPLSLKRELYALLADSLAKAKEQPAPARDGSRLGILFSLMGDALGEPVHRKSRIARYVTARTFIAYELLEEGYTTTEVGKMMGKDHATIVYLRGKMLNYFNLPLVFDEELALWKRFKQKIEDYDKTFDN